MNRIIRVLAIAGIMSATAAGGLAVQAHTARDTNRDRSAHCPVSFGWQQGVETCRPGIM